LYRKSLKPAFVAYLRVSTARQSESGLGLEAVAAKGRDADGTGK
jgi:hypothetical protein